MICSICNKNPATVHIQEIINGVKKSIHICQACAVAKGLNVPGLEGINFTEFLHNISCDTAKLSQNPVIDKNEVKTAEVFNCSKCGWDTEKMKKNGRLGCPECYHVFKDRLVQPLSVMHRGVIHCGKIPPAVAGERSVLMVNMLQMQKKLEKHIKNEEYEEAAKIRDKIKGLKFEKIEGS